MIVQAVRCTTQDERPAAERLEQCSAHSPASTVARVQYDLERARSNRGCVDDSQHRCQVPSIRIVERADLAQRIPACPLKLSLLPPVEHRATLCRTEHHARSLEELQSVVTGWVV